jgi:hypothetical protein
LAVARGLRQWRSLSEQAVQEPGQVAGGGLLAVAATENPEPLARIVLK